MTILGIIPARFGSTRLKGKPLLKIGRLTMIERVYQQVMQAKLLDEVVVATDDERIVQVIEKLGGKAILTSPDHQCGTDRCAEAYRLLGSKADFVVNVQGDEPVINPQQIDQLIEGITAQTEILTQSRSIKETDKLFDPSVVKVVVNQAAEAMYFSRQAIPFQRDVAPNEWLKNAEYLQHIGIYAFRADVLQQIAHLPPTKSELLEKVELNRWIEHQIKVKIQATEFESISVDTQEDLEKILQINDFE